MKRAAIRSTVSHGKDPIYFQQGLKLTVQQIGCGSRKAVQAAFGDRAVLSTPPGEKPTSRIFATTSGARELYCSTVYWYQTLPTPALPQAPRQSRPHRRI